ncbi:MAG: WD40 repeat domain-containing protein [Acidobacteria bacterium]|nr:WD40 repeat domain-containing protein [Acidobacteriota bacterium]
MVTALAAVSWAASPIIWQVSTQSELLEGEVENLSIDSNGRLVLAPATELVEETTAPFLWTILQAGDGAIYLGSGNEGKVFRVPPGGKASVFYDAPELEVHALAQGLDGSIYVGTSPEGKIYKVDASGSAAVFFDPDDKYIWSLVFDRAGTLFAGTGEKGIVYKIGADGKGTPLYRTETTHAVSLVLDRSGNLIVGTESPGKVFRIDSLGKAFVLLDSSFREIHALRFDEKGNLYAAAVSARAPAQETPPGRGVPEMPQPAPTPSVSTEITSISIGTLAVQPGAPDQRPARREDRRNLKGAVYRIAPDGVWDIVWESREDSPYDVSFDAADGVIIGTGNEGKIFRVAGDPAQVTLLTRAAAQQITMFLADSAGRNYYATANPGKLFRLASTRTNRGSYQSKVRDAETVAAWGTISWRGTAPAGGSIELFTRSGNTAMPDATWSDWAGPYRNSVGEQIASPKARYLQWKAVLAGKDDSPVLTSVTAAFLPRNLRPKVNEITVHPPGTVFQRPFSTGELEIAGLAEDATTTRPSASAPLQGQPAPGLGQIPALGRRIYQKGLQTFVWRSEDENDDTLVFDVLYRREGETSWKTLKRSLADPIFVWDTTSVPNGTYFVKIQASDAPSNPPGMALVGELESTSFDIDNTPPTVTMQTVRRQGERYVLSFEVRDEQSPIQRVEYSLDADRWQRIYPRDGIADSRVEQFDLELTAEAASKSVVIRVVDAMNNVATARGEVKK